MIVAYGDNNVLVIAITEAQVQEMRGGLTQTFEGFRTLVKDIVLFYGRDKEHVIQQLRAAGVKVTEGQIADYRAGKRTDRPAKPS